MKERRRQIHSLALAATGVLVMCALAVDVGGTEQGRPSGTFTELNRFAAPEARQGVAADASYLYAISNHALGKYPKAGGARVAAFECEEGKPYIHFNSGIVSDGLLYCAHSNYPGVPNRSSIEIWDTKTLQHRRSVDLGATDGSLTWIDRYEGGWIACFTHYGNRGGNPGRSPADTWLAKLDRDWRVVGRWSFPPALIEQLAPRGFAVSGGAIGPGGFLYVTGHDDPFLYVLRFPAKGTALEWIGSVPIPAEGQAFSWDPIERDVVHLILKRTREVITGRVVQPSFVGHK